MFINRRLSLRSVVYRVTITAVVLVSFNGCRDRGPDRSVVSGYVTFNGQPIANGEIRFYPTGDTKGPVSGAAIVKGEYTASAKGGVQIGSHIVRIRGFDQPNEKDGDQDRDNGEIQYIPAKFNRESTLTATIKNIAKQELDFELSSDKD